MKIKVLFFVHLSFYDVSFYFYFVLSSIPVRGTDSSASLPFIVNRFSVIAILLKTTILLSLVRSPLYSISSLFSILSRYSRRGSLCLVTSQFLSFPSLCGGASASLAPAPFPLRSALQQELAFINHRSHILTATPSPGSP